MKNKCEDDITYINYDPICREYYISGIYDDVPYIFDLNYPEEVGQSYPNAEYEEGYKPTDTGYAQVLTYCPWCGKKLPKSLRDEYFNLLLEIDEDYWSGIPIENFPEEFRSDKWWKNRGL